MLLKNYVPWSKTVLDVILKGTDRCLAIWNTNKRYAWGGYETIKASEDWVLYEKPPLGNEFLEMLAEMEPWVFIQ